MATKEDREKIEEMASKLLTLARDTITVRFRFFDNAVARIKTEFRYGINGVASDRDKLYVDPIFLLKQYVEEPGIAVRIYLHVLMHFVFLHQFQYEKLNSKYWDLAADIAVENIILEMDFKPAELTRDNEERNLLFKISKRVQGMSADKLYREFAVNGLSHDGEKQYREMFTVDLHEGWRKTAESANEITISEEEWRKITRRIKTELKTFSKDKAGTESFEKNVDEASRERYNYREILERFTTMGEEIQVNDDEFDYIYYTYGLQTYGNMPLIEPLEYKEDKRVREFVIAIDTSASCRGDTVKAFIQKTYDILMSTESFFHKMNIHIVMCDAVIQSDTKLETPEDFKTFMEKGEIKGFGSTDFRPVFAYVDELKEQGAFENLKGLIYFTDGYGIYPETMPDYDVIFAFLNEDENRMPVPGWALKVVLEDEL